jgi:hypothetical protein
MSVMWTEVGQRGFRAFAVAVKSELRLATVSELPLRRTPNVVVIWWGTVASLDFSETRA